MYHNRTLLRALGLLALVFALASCAPSIAPGTLQEPLPTHLPATVEIESSPTPRPTSTRTPLPPTATAPEPYEVVNEVEQVIGTWMFSESDFTRFYPDGTYHDAYSLAQLDDAPYAVNRIEFKDGQLLAREVSVSGVPPCGTKVGIYELRLLRSGKLQIVVIKDACGPRAGDTQGIYDSVP